MCWKFFHEKMLNKLNIYIFFAQKVQKNRVRDKIPGAKKKGTRQPKIS